jgi:hypothetical protein
VAVDFKFAPPGQQLKANLFELFSWNLEKSLYILWVWKTKKN